MVLASTFPTSSGDATPAFVRDLAVAEASEYETVVVVPAVAGGAARETVGSLGVRRFRYFPRRWEDLAEGAILENLRARPSRWLQVLPFVVAEIVAVRRVVRQFRPDVVHAHWIVPQGVAAMLAARGRPLLITTHGGDIYGLRDPLSQRLIRAVLRRASAVTAVNGDMRDRLVELGARAECVTVLPMGADVSTIRQGGVGVARRAGRILLVGRLVEKKGIAVLLAALRGLDGSGYDLRIAGDGPLRAELESAAAGLPVTFLGAVGRAEIARECAEAAIAVFPSVRATSGDQDGLPVALLEAMSAGCAVVVSDLPGLADAVVDGVSGLVVESGDESALRRALRRLLDDPDLAAELGAGARARSDEYSVDSIGARYVEVLDRIRGS